MKSKLALTVVIALGLTALAASVLAQVPSGAGERGDTDKATFPSRNRISGTYAAPSPYVPVNAEALKLRGEEADLAREADQLVQQLGEAKSDAGKEKLRTKLSEALGKQFDLRQKRHATEIEALEAQVKKLKDMVRKRQENRREIIGNRLDQLLRDAQGLGW